MSEYHKRLMSKHALVFLRRLQHVLSLVRAKLPKLQIESDKGCFRCGKSRCQLCRFMSEGNSFRSNFSEGEFKISSRYTCDSSGVVYLLGCKVCGKQNVGSIFTSFRVRFNNYKSRRYSKGEVVTQADFFRHFTEANHHVFMEDVSFQIIDRVFGESRHREGFWQFKLGSFAPEGLNARSVDSYLLF